MKKDRNNKKSKSIFIVTLVVLFTIMFLSVGYSALVANFTITGIVTKIRPNKVVRVTNVATSSPTVSDLDYNVSSIISTVNIPAGGTVTYNVTVTNLGNVPVALSGVSFSDGTNNLTNLSTTINSQNYVIICNGNNCTGPVSKDVTITVTNNGSSTITGNLISDLTFQTIYTITYDGNKIGEALSGSNFTYTFSANPPTRVKLTSGTYGSYTYNNNVLQINNVTSDIVASKAYTITYNAEIQGDVVHGGTYTYTFTSLWPKTITIDNGTYGNMTYTNDILTITNVTSNIECTGTPGEIFISSITYDSTNSVNVLRQTTPVPNGMSANFDVTYQRDANATTNDFKAVYNITLNNEYYSNYIFNGFDFNPTITANSGDSAYIEPELIGVTQGESIPARTTKSFQLVLNLIANNPNGTYGASGNAEGETTEPTVETGTLEATITPNGGDLRSPNTRVAFTVAVENTYSSAKEYRLLSSSSNFKLVDGNGNDLTTFTIQGESTDSFTVYVVTSSNAMFNSSTATTNIFLATDGAANSLISTLTFNVDVSAGVDTTPPTISSASIAMVTESPNTYPTVGALRVTWSGQDNQGGSGIDFFTIKLYNTSTGFVDSTTAAHNETSTIFRGPSGGLADGTYYAVVYAEDNYHNSGAQYESQAATSPHAAKTSETAFQWRFNVDTSGLSKLECDTTVAYLNQTYVCNMTPTGTTMNGDRVPETNTGMNSVYMGTTQLTTNSSNTSYYTYTRNSGTSATVRVYNVTNNLRLNATAGNSCLVEGTKILLANGKYKNIENIDYDDLLLVHNYETGELTKEYPIWIEQEKSIKIYQKNTFSDGTILKTVGWHGLFSTELNRFVSVDNKEEFHIGTKIAKLNKDRNGYDIVTVTNIEYITEVVNYYHVVSTRYYNIIANDLLTTDGTVALSNIYGFDKDITWPKEIRNNAMKDVYTYDDLKDAIPYYMFKGLRAEEGKFLSNYGLDLNTFKYYLSNNQNNPYMVKQPIQYYGKNMWMVSTSEDNITSLNKANYLRQEGSTYTLPNSKKGKNISWYNTADGKTYHPGDKITIDHSMYFEAIYK